MSSNLFEGFGRGFESSHLQLQRHIDQFYELQAHNIFNSHASQPGRNDRMLQYHDPMVCECVEELSVVQLFLCAKVSLRRDYVTLYLCNNDNR